MELSGSGGLTGLPVRCWRARLKWRVPAVANRSYEAEMRAAGVSAAIYERKIAGAARLGMAYLPRYPYADAPAEGVDYPTPNATAAKGQSVPSYAWKRRKCRVCISVQQGTVSSPNPTYDR